MLQTVCHIPHDFLGIPLFGWGWALWIWIAVSGVILTRMVRAHGFSGEPLNFLPSVALFAVILLFVAPHLEELPPGPDGALHPMGIAIRGYGVMLLLAVIVGVGLATHRAQTMGLPEDLILSLAFWMFLLAIFGARLFFVIQKWEQYATYHGAERVFKILNVTQGGLVVYGALIGGLVGVIWFAQRHQVPLLALLDLIAPSMVLGLAIGRIGCLMNGCCYGGICDYPWKITFPADTAPYVEQHRRGYFHEIAIQGNAEGEPIVRLLRTDGRAAQAGVTDGQLVTAVRGEDVHSKEVAQRLVDEQWILGKEQLDNPVEVARGLLWSAGRELAITTADGHDYAWAIDELPARSLPVHPTQLYSSLNALLIFFVLYTRYPMRRRDGVIVAILLSIYPITRFLLEMIRNDEGSFAGTGLTISQNVSLILLVVAIGLWAYVMRQPQGTAWPTDTAPGTPTPRL